MRPSYLCLYNHLERSYLCRIDLTEFEHTGIIPPLETVIDLEEEMLPKGMAVFSAGYELYLVGGETLTSADTADFNPVLYKLQRTDSSFKPEISSCAKSGKPFPSVVQINGKVYVLGTRPRLVSCGISSCSPTFEVYDPLKDCWESLPDPPCYGSRRASYVVNFTAFCNFIVMDTAEPSSWVFDVDTKKWTMWISSPLFKIFLSLPDPFSCGTSVAIYDDFMIAYNDMHGLVVYFLDLNCFPLWHRILDVLENVFARDALGLVHHFGNGKMCSVCFFNHDEFYLAISVAIFQVNILSKIHSGGVNPKVAVELLRHQTFKAVTVKANNDPFLFINGFIMSEDSQKHDSECQIFDKISKMARTIWGEHIQ